MAWHTLCASALAWALIGVAWDPQPARVDPEATAVPALLELTQRSAALPALRLDRIEARAAAFGLRCAREEMPVSWRLGERLIFIEGAP
jgi:hypothetical protein